MIFGFIDYLNTKQKRLVERLTINLGKMSKINDDDFDALLNNDENNENETPKKTPPKAFSDFMRSLLESMTDDNSNFQDKYGEPSSIEYSKDEDGHYIQKKIWQIDGGEVVEVNGSLTPFKDGPQPSLEELLAEAIEAEDYTLAATLRDKINDINKF
jgi:hypothetical protein